MLHGHRASNLGKDRHDSVRSFDATCDPAAIRARPETVGVAAIGGPFDLLDQDGKQFTERDLVGQYSLLYFGFTHCPDICPDELEKLAQAIDAVGEAALAYYGVATA